MSSNHQPPDPDAERPETTVGGARNEHGTRISRRITCMRCGKSDHVSFAPRDMSKALCRVCAESQLNAYEIGRKAKKAMQTLSCVVCAKAFEIPAEVEDDGEMVCKDCLKGFMSWQGSLKTPTEQRGQSELRRSGARIRRKPGSS